MLSLLQSEGDSAVYLGKVFAIAIACTSLFAFVYRLAFDPLRDIQGPFLGRFTRLWELQQIISGGWHQIVIKLQKQYGFINI
jgi:hypothetical protein